MQRDLTHGGAAPVAGWQQDPSATQTENDLAVVEAGQGIWAGAESAGVAQHRVDVGPAGIIGVYGGSDVTARTMGDQESGRGQDRRAGAVDVAMAVAGPGGRHELHGSLRSGAARPGDAAEGGFPEIDRRQVSP